MTKQIIKIGTRGSQLALWQANWVKSQIERISNVQTEIIKIKTTGDQITDRPLSMVGGKGLFVKEIEQQLLDRDIDIAVHSMKDMPGELPEGLTVGAIPVRANPFDVLISRDNIPLDALPAGARIGTSSLRRASQLKHARPDITTLSIRGNLDTRLRKLDTGEYDAIILAAAGLVRLGMADRITEYLDEDLMVPAVGQGALCIESRQSLVQSVCKNHIESDQHDVNILLNQDVQTSLNQHDVLISQILAKLDDISSRIPVEAERAFLKRMEGSCHIPVACFGKLRNGENAGGSILLVLTGLVASEDGTRVIRETMTAQLKIPATETVTAQLEIPDGMTVNAPLKIPANSLNISAKEPLHIESISKAARKTGIELAETLLAKGAKQILQNLKN
ncbi:MAG: hydroxymethylbilane synthase [Desulfamplus sp.]|nr:hydroxymethylbilane synthase [Desulfamplus sp.]